MWLRGRMYGTECDPEEKVILKNVLHITKSVAIIYIWISTVYIMTLLYCTYGSVPLVNDLSSVNCFSIS